MPTESLHGTTFHYSESGSGSALALIHGFPLDSGMWQLQVAPLADRFQVIAPDLRGFGKSTSLEAFTIASLADDVHALLEKIGALPCVLCGFSMGGYVALAFAKKYPSDLRGLVLVDTRAEADAPEGKANRNKMIDLVRASGSKAVAELMIPKLLSDQTLRSHPPIVQQVRDMIESCPPRTIEHALAAMRDREDYTALFPSIAIPALIIVGEHDALTPPPMSRAMHAGIARSKLALIPGAGHLAPLEQPDAVSRELTQFLSGQG